MQFYNKVKNYVGQKRIKRKFTIFPRKINKTIYWLEYIYISQEYQKFRDISAREFFWHKWIDIHLTTKSEYEKHRKINK